MTAGPEHPGRCQTALQLVIWNHDPVAGCLYSSEERSHPFTGWIELAAAIATELETSGSPPDAKVTEGA